MPKAIIDYSNTIIYKIYCKDSSINDLYVGHTTNFTKRKYQHKLSCNNGKKLKIYDVIRSNGGWDNWDMIEIAKYECKDVVEARIKENEHYVILNASLNCVAPYKDKTILFCSTCNIQNDTIMQFQNHINSLKHKKKKYNIENGIVLDPYCGSGTTLVAAKFLNKNFIGIDISPKYVDISQKRLQNYTQEESKIQEELNKHLVIKTFTERKQEKKYKNIDSQKQSNLNLF